jgi:LmbE family N-acetylglucosaminyl deacetylase
MPEGLPDTTAVSPILVVSPHFDDAVLSCGRFLSVHRGITVLTVMGGSPDSWDTYCQWDNSPDLCNFPVGTDVIAARVAEDAKALAVLECEQATLPNALDIQYEPNLSERPGIIRDGIEDALERIRPTICLVPLGTAHPDHKEVRRLSLLIADADDSHCSWFLYEELPYRPRLNADYQAALAEVRLRWDIEPAVFDLDPDGQEKETAVACYESQLRAIEEGDNGLFADIADEGYWRLVQSK